MLCPKCHYQLDDWDRECPKCHGRRIVPAIAPVNPVAALPLANASSPNTSSPTTPRSYRSSPFIWVMRWMFLVSMLFSFFRPLLRSQNAPGGFWQNLTHDNATTTGTVLAVGPSSVTRAPYTVRYGYNTPDMPRKPWSYQREQVVTASQMAHFKPGMTVTVEYSRALSGASRIQGMGGTGSVYVHELLPWCLLAMAPMLVIWTLSLWRYWKART